MAATVGLRPSRSGLVVVVAVLLGLTGALLFSAPSRSAGIALLPSTSPVAAPSWLAPVLIGLIVALVVVVGLGSRSRRVAENGFAPAIFLSIGLLIALGFYLVLRLIAPHGNPASSRSGGPAPPCDPSDPSCSNPPPSGGGGIGGLGSAPPTGEAYLVIGLLLVALVVAAILVPRALAYRAERGTPGIDPGSSARGDLETALGRLRAAGPGDDARSRIIRAYGELLRKVALGLPTLETSTPREIARECEVVYRIRPETAATLTGLFEEARYSHGAPMGPDAVDRAEAALRAALAEMTSSRGRRTA